MRGLLRIGRVSIKVRSSNAKYHIKEIGEMEKIDRTEVVKRLLSNAAKHWKIERALNLLRDGKVTLRRAAKIAEVTYVEMLDLSSQMDIAIYTVIESTKSDTSIHK